MIKHAHLSAAIAQKLATAAAAEKFARDLRKQARQYDQRATALREEAAALDSYEPERSNTLFVHNHGPEDGPGLSCRERRLPDGKLRGACQDRTAPAPSLNRSGYPATPEGYVACRTIQRDSTITHLVELDEKGRNGGRPTVCGLTRFDARDAHGHTIPGTATLPGWGMGDSGITGPAVDQLICVSCYTSAETGGQIR